MDDVDVRLVLELDRSASGVHRVLARLHQRGLEVNVVDVCQVEGRGPG